MDGIETPQGQGNILDFPTNEFLDQLEPTGAPPGKKEPAAKKSEPAAKKPAAAPEGDLPDFGGNPDLERFERGDFSPSAEDLDSDSDDDDVDDNEAGADEKTDEELINTPPRDLTKEENKRRKKAMREQIKDLQGLLREAKAQNSSAVEPIQKKLDAAEAREAELIKEVQTLRGRSVRDMMPDYDPQNDAEVVEVLKRQQRVISRVAARIPGFEEKVLPLAQAFHEAQKSGKEALRKFTAKIDDEYGARADAVIDAIGDYVSLYGEAAEIAQKNQSKWLGTLSKEYSRRRDDYSESLRTIGNASPEDMNKDPRSVNAILTRAVQSNPQLAEQLERTKQAAVDMVVGLEPAVPGSRWQDHLDPNGQLTQEGQQLFLAEAQRLREQQRAIVAQWAQYRVAAMLLPSAIKRTAELEERLGQRRQEEPVHQSDSSRTREESTDPRPASANVEVDDAAQIANPHLAGF